MTAVATRPTAIKPVNRRNTSAKPTLRSQQAPRINSRVHLDSCSFSGLG